MNRARISLVLLALLASSCGGASKAPAVASFGPSVTTTPGSAGPGGSAAPGNTRALEFASCMRSRGVRSFPDPGGLVVPGIKQVPGFEAAMATCNKRYPSSPSTGANLTAAQRSAAIAQARCIRGHGVPDFPDPTFPRSGGELFPAIPGFDPASPAFRHAAAACGLKGPVGQPRGG